MTATADESAGLIDAIREDPFDAVSRLVCADWLAFAGDAEGEAWQRWAASKCDRMADSTGTFAVYAGRTVGAAHQFPDVFFGSVAALEARIAVWKLGRLRTLAVAPVRIVAGLALLQVADFDSFLELGVSHSRRAEIPQADCRRIIREAFGD